MVSEGAAMSGVLEKNLLSSGFKPPDVSSRKIKDTERIRPNMATTAGLLCARYRHFWAKGKVKPVIVTAIARELCGFIWAIAIKTDIPVAV